MRIEQSEVCDKAWVTKFCVFFTAPGVVANLWFFDALKELFQEENSEFLIFHHVPHKLFSILLDLSWHSLLIAKNLSTRFSI